MSSLKRERKPNNEKHKLQSNINAARSEKVALPTKKKASRKHHLLVAPGHATDDHQSRSKMEALKAHKHDYVREQGRILIRSKGVSPVSPVMRQLLSIMVAREGFIRRLKVAVRQFDASLDNFETHQSEEGEEKLVVASTG